MPERRQEQRTCDKISIYLPKKKADESVVPRLRKLGEKKERSINYLVVEAIVQYPEREEKKA